LFSIYRNKISLWQIQYFTIFLQEFILINSASKYSPQEKPSQFAGGVLLQFLDELNRFAGLGGGGEDCFLVRLHDGYLSLPKGEPWGVVLPRPSTGSG